MFARHPSLRAITLVVFAALGTWFLWKLQRSPDGVAGVDQNSGEVGLPGWEGPDLRASAIQAHTPPEAPKESGKPASKETRSEPRQETRQPITPIEAPDWVEEEREPAAPPPLLWTVQDELAQTRGEVQALLRLRVAGEPVTIELTSDSFGRWKIPAEYRQPNVLFLGLESVKPEVELTALGQEERRALNEGTIVREQPNAQFSLSVFTEHDEPSSTPFAIALHKSGFPAATYVSAVSSDGRAAVHCPPGIYDVRVHFAGAVQLVPSRSGFDEFRVTLRRGVHSFRTMVEPAWKMETRKLRTSPGSPNLHPDRLAFLPKGFPPEADAIAWSADSEGNFQVRVPERRQPKTRPQWKAESTELAGYLGREFVWGFQSRGSRVTPNAHRRAERELRLGPLAGQGVDCQIYSTEDQTTLQAGRDIPWKRRTWDDPSVLLQAPDRLLIDSVYVSGSWHHARFQIGFAFNKEPLQVVEDIHLAVLPGPKQPDLRRALKRAPRPRWSIRSNFSNYGWITADLNYAPGQNLFLPYDQNVQDRMGALSWANHQEPGKLGLGATELDPRRLDLHADFPLRTVVVRCVTSEGRRLPYAMVQGDSGTEQGTQWATADEKGVLRVFVWGEDSYFLDVGFRDRAQAIRITPDMNPGHVTLVFPPRIPNLTVQATTQHDPLRYSAHIMPIRPNRAPDGWAPGEILSDRLQPDGSFHVRGLAPGRYLLQVSDLKNSSTHEQVIVEMPPDGSDQRAQLKVGR